MLTEKPYFPLLSETNVELDKCGTESEFILNNNISYVTTCLQKWSRQLDHR